MLFERAQAIFNLIAYYNNSGQIDEALPFYEILVNLASDHSDKPGLSFTQGHVAYIIVEAYHRSNQNEKAKSFAQKASDVLLSLDFFNLSNLLPRLVALG